jgi:L-ascorbate metabolism protein UlaG (beta-lactamase superfamily)
MNVVLRSAGATVIAAALLYGCVSQPRHRGASNEHFNGVRFFNALPAEKSLLDIAKFLTTYRWRRETWPTWVDNAQYPPVDAPNQGVLVTFVNHSTVLLQIAGLNVLTDPIWSERASPFRFVGPKRVRGAGIKMADLPPIDVVLVSHDHYDHLDIDTLKMLGQHGRNGPPLILAGLGNEGLFEAHGVENYRVLDWWQTHSHGGVEFAFVEVRHRSGRGLTDQMKSLWGGFVIRAAVGQIYFAGDTGFGPHFADARQRYGEFDVSLLPIGA